MIRKIGWTGLGLLIVGVMLDLAGGLLHLEGPIDVGLPLAKFGLILSAVSVVGGLARKVLSKG